MQEVSVYDVLVLSRDVDGPHECHFKISDGRFGRDFDFGEQEWDDFHSVSTVLLHFRECTATKGLYTTQQILCRGGAKLVFCIATLKLRSPKRKKTMRLKICVGEEREMNFVIFLRIKYFISIISLTLTK
ncbi:hypothetical protein AAZV13_13G086100 [Glycine max]